VNKAIFLDRDGVINRSAGDGKYITHWQEMRFLPGVVEAIGLLNRGGFLVIVVTNQRCVAKGLITTEGLEALHQKMRSELALAGARIDQVYYCPHDAQQACGCRKPAPGMLLQAAQEHVISLSESWMVGDSASDVEAGRRAGCKTARIEYHHSFPGSSGDVTASSLIDVVIQLLDRDKMSAQFCTV